MSPPAILSKEIPDIEVRIYNNRSCFLHLKLNNNQLKLVFR